MRFLTPDPARRHHRCGVYYEPEGQGNPSATQLASDLAYIKSHYAGDPAYLRLGGKPVIFVYANGSDGCGMADRWKQANAGQGFYVVLKVFAGYTGCASQPDGWHQYGPSVAYDRQGASSVALKPSRSPAPLRPPRGMRCYTPRMAGYSGTPLTKKIGAKPGQRALVIGAPPDAPQLFEDGVQVLLRAAEDLDAIVLFVTERRVLERRLPELRRRLAPTGMLWVAWPKKASGVATDVTEDVIRDFAVSETDLVDVKVIAIDETWSGLKLMVRRAAR